MDKLCLFMLIIIILLSVFFCNFFTQFFQLLLIHTLWNFTDRMHVIDSLPLIWMLDGRIITCKSQLCDPATSILMAQKKTI